MAVKNFIRFKINSLLFLKNSSGVAMVELLPLVMLILVLVSLTFGLWTSIHAGTLRSIASRHYAFEVINNRANFNCHRDTNKCGSEDYYKTMGYRFFAVVKEDQHTPKPKQIAKKSWLNLFKGFDDSFRSNPPRVCTSQKCANPILLKQGYGICIDCNCGGRGFPGFCN